VASVVSVEVIAAAVSALLVAAAPLPAATARHSLLERIVSVITSAVIATAPAAPTAIVR
jgi:hypothetical protein